MSVKDLLDKKIAERKVQQEEERQAALRRSEAQHDELAKVCDQIEVSLEGLDWRKMEHLGQYHVRYMEQDVYIEAKWHDDHLRIATSIRAINCSDCYIHLDFFEESLANFLLQFN